MAPSLRIVLIGCSGTLSHDAAKIWPDLGSLAL